MLRWLAALALWAVAGSANAQSPAEYKARTDQLLMLLKADGGEEAYFSPIFTRAVPVAQWRSITKSLRNQYGAVQSIERIAPENATSALVEVGYARAVVSINLVLSPNAPHSVIGLRIIGTRAREDSSAQILADIAALPGKAAISVSRLTDAGPEPVFGSDQKLAQAVGSEFKLYILAELARSVRAGERRWSDVVPLDHKSFSGRLSTWPDKAPMTLHSLATAMIAESDNGAADTLLHALGRDKVDAMVAATGHAAPVRTLPILSTVEAFALKQPGQTKDRATYASGSTADRLAFLKDRQSTFTRNRIDVAQVADTPVAIDTIEWFAAPDDMVRLLDWLRRYGGEALPILAVNPGIGTGDAARWTYLGYKGGSEPGVMAMSFLACTREQQCYAVSGSWNNPMATLDNDRFVAIMTRALNLIATVRPSTPPPAP